MKTAEYRHLSQVLKVQHSNILSSSFSSVKTGINYPPIRVAAIKKTTSVGKDVEKLQPCVLVVGYKMMQLLWKTTWRFFKKAKHRIDVIQQFYFWVYPQKSRKQSLKQIFVPSCSQQKYSQEPKKWSNPTVHRQMNGVFFVKKRNICIPWTISQF